MVVTRVKIGGRERFDSIQKQKRGRPKHLKMFNKSKPILKWLVRHPWVRPMCIFNYAAIMIQKIFRGHLIRRLGRYWRDREKNYHSKIGKRRDRGMLSKYLAYLDHFKTHGLEVPPTLSGGYSTWCIVRIQAWFRMLRAVRRFSYTRKVYYHIAAMDIQAAWRNHRHNVLLQSHLIRDPKPLYSIEQAVLRMQLCWRSYCNRRIFRYFRDLLKYKLQGEPIDLLKTIAPGEVDILDRAAGVHVRFRLGGRIFPPKIYFKVYTHRPLCDVNAFAPRNYTLEAPASTFQRHNKSETIPDYIKRKSNIKVGKSNFAALVKTSEDTSGWYTRKDNNEWRCISSQKIEDFLAPPGSMDRLARRAATPFHYSRLKRKEDLVAERKRRKREWMMKAYTMAAAGHSALDHGSDAGDRYSSDPGDGRQREEMKEGHTAPHVRMSEPADVYRAEEKHASSRLYEESNKRSSSHKTSGGGGQMNLEDDLLLWSAALDYEEYAKEWTSLGTSLPSDMKYTGSTMTATYKGSSAKG